MSVTKDIKIVRDGTADGHHSISQPAGAGTNLYSGEIAATQGGYLVNPDSPSTAMTVWGLLNGLIDGSPHVSAPMATTNNGDHVLGIDTGSFWVRAGTSGDALTQADVGATVYLIDGQTVGKTNGSTTRPAAGTLNRVTGGPSGFVSVRFNPAANP